MIYFYAGPKLPEPLWSHTKVQLDNDLIIFGGISNWHSQSNIYSFSCSQQNCIWTKLSQKLSIPRYNAIAMLIPDSLTNCGKKVKKLNEIN